MISVRLLTTRSKVRTYRSALTYAASTKKTPKSFTLSRLTTADAISAARPAARSENYENYIKRLEKLEEICCSYNGVEKSYAIQAGREVRIMIKPETITDDGMKVLARDIAKRIENEMEYPGQIKINLIRESRAVDYAK